MAFTRKFLSALGIEADTIEQLIEAHVDVVDGLKAEIEKLKTDADSASELQKQLNEANMKLAAAEKDDYKGKYESEKAEHEKLKTQIAADKMLNAKGSAYQKALKEAGIPENRIPTLLNVAKKTDFDGIEFDEKNNIKDLNREIENIRAEYGGLIPSTEITGTDPETPPESRENQSGRTGIAARLQKQYQESMYGVK